MTTAIATRRYEPMAEVGSVGDLKSMLGQLSDSIRETLPKHVTPERLIKTMLVAANRNPDLLQCTQSSVIETISRASELGLDLSGTLGEAYPVPFNNRVKDQWFKQCTLIIGYRGLAKLARQSGEIARIDADVVYEHDKFVFRKGTNGCCEFEPNWRGDRGPAIGAYAYTQFKDGGEQYDFMTVGEIDEIRKRSKSGNDRNGNPVGAWKSDWAEMAKKTVFRRLSKWLPLSAEKFQQAIEIDNNDFGDPMNLVSVETNFTAKQSGAQALTSKLTGNKPVIDEPVKNTEPVPDVADAQVDTETGDTGLSVVDELLDYASGAMGCNQTQAERRLIDAAKQEFNTADLSKLNNDQLAAMYSLIQAEKV